MDKPEFLKQGAAKTAPGAGADPPPQPMGPLPDIMPDTKGGPDLLPKADPPGRDGMMPDAKPYKVSER
jgi:hypothetical protein